MGFVEKEHGGIDPEKCDRPFFLKHFAAYRFIKNIIKGKKVLEIGFGSGYGSNYISKFAEEVIAIDLFEKNVDSAKMKWKEPNLCFQKMDACNLQFNGKKFDVIVAFQLIEHIPRELHLTFLENIKKAAAENGILVISTPNLENLKKKNVKYKKNLHHDLEFTPIQFQEILSKKFNNVEVYGVGYSKMYKFFLLLKKSGFFKYLPDVINPVKRYFRNMPEKDFIITKNISKHVPDILAVVKT